jgi:hypothetical protein
MKAKKLRKEVETIVPICIRVNPSHPFEAKTPSSVRNIRTEKIKLIGIIDRKVRELINQKG